MRKLSAIALAVLLLSGCGSSSVSVNKSLVKVWSYQEFEQPLSVGVRVTGDKTMAVSIAGTEYALLDTPTGQNLWHKTLEIEPDTDNNFPPINAGGRMVFSAASKLQCFDMENGTPLWEVGTRDTDIGPASFNEPTYADGRIYAGTSSGSLLCIDAPSGVQNWEIKSSEDAYGPSIAMKNKVITMMLSSRIECRRQDQGWVVWSNGHFRMPLQPVPNDGKILYLSNPGPSIAALNPDDMKVLWEKTINHKSGILEINPCLDGQNLVCCDENKVYIFDKTTGEQKGVFEIPFDPEIMRTNNGLIYIVSKNILYCYNKSGVLVGQFKEPNGDRIFGVDFGKSLAVCWTSRTIYGLVKGN